MHILLLDNFDSFTYNLLDYLQQVGVTAHVYRNDVPLVEIEEHQYDGVVLSPGPGTPNSAGHLLEVIERYYRELPMLGVCLGYQSLGQLFGAHVVRAVRPMHGKVSKVKCAVDDPLFSGLP